MPHVSFDAAEIESSSADSAGSEGMPQIGVGHPPFEARPANHP
jgi:hypothetical protein